MTMNYLVTLNNDNELSGNLNKDNELSGHVNDDNELSGLACTCCQ